jgi:hypothetical protein
MTKNDEKLQKMTYRIYIFVTRSSYPGFIYLKEPHMIHGKKDDMSSKSGP